MAHWRAGCECRHFRRRNRSYSDKTVKPNCRARHHALSEFGLGNHPGRLYFGFGRSRSGGGGLFLNSDQNGWVSLINRVVYPEAGDFVGVNPPSILSCSDFISAGDDTNGLLGISLNMIQAVDMALQDAAIQGITVCVASGDRGSTSGFTDGFAHVQYPASDPWVLTVGGTTLGGPTAGSQPPPWLEYVWNDLYYWGVAGATGGGVSAIFPVPPYQSAAGITPATINPTNNANNPFNATGRGIPDVAANASGNSGYPITIGASNFGPANGTSASTPLWAGLIALINSNLGYNVGFLNPILYQLGSGAFNPINPLYPVPGTPYANCPADNGIGVTGYPAQARWDACTGLGSPNGAALLAALNTGLFFIVDQEMFGLAAVQAGLQSASSAVFDQVFFVVLDGFTPLQLGITGPGVSPTTTPNITGFPVGMTYSLASFQPAIPITTTNLNISQRFTFAYNVSFTSAALSSFLGPGLTSPVTMTGNFAAASLTVSNTATLLLDNLPEALSCSRLGHVLVEQRYSGVPDYPNRPAEQLNRVGVVPAGNPATTTRRKFILWHQYRSAQHGQLFLRCHSLHPKHHLNL